MSHDAPTLIDLGRQHLQLRQYHDALQQFDQALSLNPDLADAWNGRGAALKNLGRPQEALTAYDRALTVDATSYKAWFNKALLLEQLDRYLEAIACYQSALHIKPDFKEAHHNYTSLQNQLRPFKTIAEQGDAERQLMLGLDRQLAQDWEGALAAFKQAIALNPNFYEAWFNQAVMLTFMQSWEESLASFDRVLQLAPDDAEAWRYQGEVQAQLQQIDEARASFAQALEFRPGWFDAESVLRDIVAR